MKDKFYVTTSIAYTNSAPHIGYALELVQADVIARYQRVLDKKKEVFFLTGTDEHGAKIVKAAEKAGKNVTDFTDEISSKFKELAKTLNISNDDFIRTTDQKRHWPTVQAIWNKLASQGDIYNKKYKGLYCVGCEAFVKEKDLLDGKCPIHHQEPEEIEEENYFFRLSKPEYIDKVKTALENNEIRIIPSSRKKEILSFIEQGVEDMSCSRSRESLKWGIPVPGDEGQIIYIWFEALINYISALESSGKRYLWPADVHCVGKDIFRFHCLLWPAMLMAYGLELPKLVFVHGYITSNGEKMSKSIGNVIDPFELIGKYGLDPVRYYLLREFSSTEDGDFTYERFEDRYNSDLANGIGNTVSRILSMAEKYWGDKIPNIDKNKTGINTIEYWISPGTGRNPFTLKADSEQKWDFLKSFFDEFLFNSALLSITNFAKNCDVYIEASKLYNPSERLDNDQEKINIALYDLLESLRQIAWMIYPFLPSTSEKIFGKLGINVVKEIEKGLEEGIKWGGLSSGNKINKGDALFPRI